jgi:hypothetical protein
VIVLPVLFEDRVKAVIELAKKGEGLMRRLAVSSDPVVMLDAALQEAAKSAGLDLTIENGSIFVAL